MIGEGALSRIATTLSYIIYVQCLFEHMDSAIATYVSIHMTVTSETQRRMPQEIREQSSGPFQFTK